MQHSSFDNTQNTLASRRTSLEKQIMVPLHQRFRTSYQIYRLMQRIFRIYTLFHEQFCVMAMLCKQPSEGFSGFANKILETVWEIFVQSPASGTSFGLIKNFAA